MKIKKNGKVINLTESDLRRIVKKVIKEQEQPKEKAKPQYKLVKSFGLEDYNQKPTGQEIALYGGYVVDPETKKQHKLYGFAVKGKDNTLSRIYPNGHVAFGPAKDKKRLYKALGAKDKFVYNAYVDQIVGELKSAFPELKNVYIQKAS
jgi:hypothetical protein